MKLKPLMQKFLKNNYWYILLISSITISSFYISNTAYGQVTVNVTESTPCFLNYTASYNILSNCNADGDFLGFFMEGWEWVTGGYFTMIIVSLIIGTVYIKYREAIYAIYIGIVFLPISYMYFPDVFISWAVIMAFVGVGTLIWYALIRQTQ